MAGENSMYENIGSGASVGDDASVAHDWVGRDRITNQYAGMDVGEMFALNLVVTLETLYGLTEPLAYNPQDRRITYFVDHRLSTDLAN